MKILDIIIATPLFEMAYSRKIAKDMVTELSPQIFDHLLKLFVFESPENVHHWRREITIWLLKINKLYLKSNTKKPSKEDLYNWLILDAAPHYSEKYIKNTIDIMLDDEYKNIKLRDYDVEFILNKIFGIIGKVCEDITSDKFRKIDDYL